MTASQLLASFLWQAAFDFQFAGKCRDDKWRFVRNMLWIHAMEDQ